MRPAGITLEWEEIDTEHQRCKVPGGWLIKAFAPVCHNLFEQGRAMEDGWDYRIAICFVPDANGMWGPR